MIVAMSTAQLRQRIKKQVDGLPTDRLRSAADYIAFLHSQAKPSAADLRKIARMKKAIDQAEREFAAGKGVGLESLKRKY